MTKPYLLIAWRCYYPGGGTDDWVCCFKTREEAEADVEELAEDTFFLRGPRKGQLKERRRCGYRIKSWGRDVDGYEIVDLREWSER